MLEKHQLLSQKKCDLCRQSEKNIYGLGGILKRSVFHLDQI